MSAAKNTLKPCPFCGGAALCEFVFKSPHLPAGATRVFCRKCGITSHYWRCKEDAYKVWNRRK